MNLQLKVEQDTDLMESPRDWDNLGTMICWHNRYSLGDKQYIYDDPDHFRHCTRHLQLISLPLFLYDHSGISISTRSFIGRAQHAEWDSGQVGWIYVEREKVLKEFNWKNLTAKRFNKVLDLLRAEVEVYDQFLRGDVWGYIVEDDETDETLDSCWGFYGHDYCEQEGKSVLAWYEQEAAEKELQLMARLELAVSS